MANALRVAIYARFSSDNQRDTSIDDQVRVCSRHMERQGWAASPELIFADYSVSGASVAREAFDRLHELVRQVPPAVDVIVTENTDRLSRDLGDADRFYKQLEYAGVRLICVHDGVDSLRKGARMTYAMKALMSDYFLEDLRDKTLRGLQGQALRGFSTGGLPLGYLSEPIGDPKKPDGHRPRIDENSAQLVLRIFTLYRDGFSYLAIATTLNNEKVPPPRARSTNTRGWVASTIREILQNESYIGRWSYARRQWKKVPGTNSRRPKNRAAEDVMRFERPELRIVPPELWDEVRARRAAVNTKYAGSPDGRRGAPGRRTSYPFSGLLSCGACGAPMVIMGGSSGRYYRCGDVHKRGTCSNRLSVRENVVREILFGELERVLASDLGVTYARRRLAEKLGELSRGLNQEKARVKKQIAKIEKQLGQLVAFVQDNAGDGAALVPVRESLAALQRQREGLHVELETLSKRAAEPVALPTPDEVKTVVFDLKKLLGSDPVRAREALRRFFKNGTIVLDPQEDSTYIAKGELLPLMVIPAQKAKPRSPSIGAAVYIDGCAGAIRPMYREVSMGFKIRLAA